MILKGRRKIFAIDEINKDNIIETVNNALCYHFENMVEEEYLYWYRRGVQPILDREKKIRSDINNKVVINNADQIVVFKNGYFLPKPAFYVTRKDNANKIEKLNEFLYTSGKQTVDNQLADWFHTVGLGVLFARANKENDKEKPVEVFCLDPRTAFTTYSRKVGNPANMGINIVQNDEKVYIDVWTKDSVYHLYGSMKPKIDTNSVMVAEASSIVKIEPNPLGMIPIIEYQFNSNRMGAFETCLSLMDSINRIESNRLDGVEQFIQSLAVAVNCQFPEGTTIKEIMKAGMIVLKSIGENKADFKIISEQLDQTQTQTTLDNYYEQLCDKAGIPYVNRSGGGSSDNVGAVYLRNGWAMADTHCRNTEDLFKESNRLFDKLFLNILKTKANFEISINDFEIQIPREEMSNLLVKTQGALNLKQLGLSPEKVLAMSGLSNDPVNDVAQSREYIDRAWGNSQEVTDDANGYANVVKAYTRRPRGSASNAEVEEVAKEEVDE